MMTKFGLILGISIGWLLCQLIDKIKFEIHFYNMYINNKSMARRLYGDKTPLFYYFVYDVKEQRRKEMRRKKIISLKANYLYRLLSRDGVNKEKLFKSCLKDFRRMFNKQEIALLLQLFVDKLEDEDVIKLEKIYSPLCGCLDKSSFATILYCEIMKTLENKSN